LSALELIRFAVGALRGQRLRSALSALGVAIGVAAVVLLTSLGEGTRQFIVGQFTQFGTDILEISPGKVKTMGLPGVLGGTTHKLTIDDAEAVRALPGVAAVLPLVMGQARVEAGGRGRSVYIYGVGHEMQQVWHVRVAQGSFLPAMDPHRQGSFAVLGPKLAREVFGDASPLGERVRVGSLSLLVIGVLEPKGQLLGFDMDDSAYLPVGTAMALFDQSELMAIDVLAARAEGIPTVVARIRALLKERHRGEDDVTVMTQGEMLDTLGRVIGIITIAVTAIAGVSLLVGAIGILTVMWISVNERTAEIGLLRALGVSEGGVGALFLVEAAVLAVAGGAGGLLLAAALSSAIRVIAPGLPLETPPLAIPVAVLASALVGIASGWAPARRAASLDPVDALRAE
jgi:putative ABC transport system permease protein